MEVLNIKTLAIPDIKVIRFERFPDHRGYFSETYGKNSLKENPETGFLNEVNFVQANESYSKKGVMRGLHFQWNPYMGKLVRVLYGRMVDFALDIRKNSPTFGKIVGFEMSSVESENFGEWIWVPPGFAHGVMFLEDSLIEYFCSGEYSPKCEAGISPLSADIDWSLCEFDGCLKNDLILSDKDKNAPSVSAWEKDERSNNFIWKS